MKILFVVTARGGSKGIPRKNIMQLGKYPLIAYKIIAAQKCKYEKRIIVSTDDEEIADIARSFGAEIPFMRPHELATDTADSMAVVAHAMDWIKKNDNSVYDYVCLLEPSSPFLSYEDINKAFELLAKTGADTLLGMKEIEVSSEFVHHLDERGGLSLFYQSIKDLVSVRRQDQKQEYTMNGCIYAARWKYFDRNHLFHSEHSIPYIMPLEQSIEIDTPFDYLIAQCIVDNHLVDLELWESIAT